MNSTQARYCSLVIAAVCTLCCCGQGPVISRQSDTLIDIMEEPQQVGITYDTTISVSIDKGEFTFMLRDRYSLSGIVVCKQSYSHGWAAQIVPIDLTFCWGKITQDYVRKHISFKHRGRWYYYKYTEDCPVSNQYIIRHTSNNHIVPANENVLRAVEKIKKNNTVRLEGYLIDIKGRYNGDPCWWNTSRSREDTGAHSCEVFYVILVQINKDIYE